MAEAWSNIEVEVIVADYLNMLSAELKGISVNKTEHRNKLKPLLKNRSDGSIEFKHQNISAVLIKLGLPYIKGYKPRWNYQSILEEKLINVVKSQRLSLERTFSAFADAQPIHVPIVDFSNMVDSAPERNILAEPEVKYERKPIKINYLEREQRNASLGLKGEEFVIQYEKWRFQNEGLEKWIDNIEWVSQHDDGAGFDILSRNKNGSDRYIEVKTTKLNKETPIFFSKNELEFSQEKKEDYHLYRLFNFTTDPKLFCVNGDFDSFCRKEATQFKGYF
jgi:hypothetical protein